MNLEASADPMAGFFIILQYGVNGHERQRHLIDGLAGLAETWVRHHPGFVSANFHASTDGTRVINIVRWRDEQAYRDFLANSPAEPRLAAIMRVLESVGDVEPPSMTLIPSYVLLRTVTP